MGFDLNTHTPKVSWLLCSNIANDQLRIAIDSCLSQTFEDFELIVVANGKCASEVELEIGMWFPNEPRLRIFKTEIHHLNFSLSLGLHYARAELIARMDSDDLSYPHRLTMQVEFMEHNPSVAVLGTAYELIDHLGNRLQSVTPPISDLEIRRVLPYRNPMCHPTVMFRRSVVMSAGGYIGMIFAQDYDLWLRLAANPSIQFSNLAQVCLGYRAISGGHARKARSAYAGMAASQMYIFLMSCKPSWFLGTLISAAKALSRQFPLQSEGKRKPE